MASAVFGMFRVMGTTSQADMKGKCGEIGCARGSLLQYPLC